MVVRNPTSSGIERAVRCPGSLRLPVLREETEPSIRGTAIHAFLEDCLPLGRDAALEKVDDEHRPAAEAIDPALIAILDPSTMVAEISFAYSLDLDIGRELGRGLARDDAYRGAHPGEWVGTADLVWLEGDDTVVVLDHKTGRSAVTRAAANWQLRSLALYACATYNRTLARVGIVSARPDEPARFDMAEFDALELAEIRAQLADLQQRIQNENAPRVMGGHCRLCPSFSYCPEQHALLRVAVEKPAHLDAMQEVALAADDRAKAHQIWQAVKTLAARLGDRVNAVASYQAIDLGDGRRYGWAKGDERIVDASLVATILERHTSPEVAAAAVRTVTTRETTKKDVEKALMEHAGMKGKRARERDGVFQALRIGGAMKQGVSLREHDAKDTSEEGGK